MAGTDPETLQQDADVSGGVPLIQRVGAVLWPSFFAAGVATMVFFAFVDPVELGTITFPQVLVSRELGYTLGFFMFWACTFSSSLFTSILLRTRREIDGVK
ncbi:MAG: hypothetical protein AB7E72_11880 [Lysobacterales bacterium]